MLTAAGSTLAVTALAVGVAAALAIAVPPPAARVPAAAAAVAGPVPGPDDAVPDGRAGRYLAPLDGEPDVVRPFAAPSGPWAAGHRGVDLAAEVGAAVLAPADGTVAFAGTVVDRGVVTVAHADGLRSSLEPVAWSVRAGDRVLRGEQVGTVQAVAGHCDPATCLHWGVRRGETYLDPIGLLVGASPVVLLPAR